uniref:Hyaluronan and proteoglycan link protein 3 n=2 Tax=Ornithorhynchus anatinus TaxID=9258 RepID=F6PGB6_ORNAN
MVLPPHPPLKGEVSVGPSGSSRLQAPRNFPTGGSVALCRVWERGVCPFKRLAQEGRRLSRAVSSLVIREPKTHLRVAVQPHPLSRVEPRSIRLAHQPARRPAAAAEISPRRAGIPGRGMMLLPLVALLLFLPGCPGLPFYNGFYYGNVMNDRGYSNGNGPGEGLFNGVKLVVETPEEALFSHRGANVTLPCHYHYEPALGSPRPVRVKWWKLGEGGEPERDVLVAIGLRHRSFGEFRGRVHLQQENGRDVSLVIRDLRLRDYGRYRCEVIDGLEDESGVVDLELRGVVFPYQPRLGRYQLNFHEAQRACEGQDAAVASFEQLFRAWEEGLDWCNAGWLLDGTVQYPITQPRQPCGGHGTAPGVRSYGQRHRSRHRYDVFCFSAAQRGRVYYLEHPEKLTLAEAEAACLEDGARIAKVGQLFSAWRFQGLDRCDTGWLDDGSARYPVTRPRPNCGSTDPGVRSFGFPDPESRSF